MRDKHDKSNVLNRPHFFAKKQAKKAPVPTLKLTAARKNNTVVTLFPALNAELEKLSQLLIVAEKIEKNDATSFLNSSRGLFTPSLRPTKQGRFFKPRPAVTNNNRAKPFTPSLK